MGIAGCYDLTVELIIFFKFTLSDMSYGITGEFILCLLRFFASDNNIVPVVKSL